LSGHNTPTKIAGGPFFAARYTMDEITLLRAKNEELETEIAALKVDLSYWHERYRLSRIPACEAGKCMAAKTLSLIPKEIVRKAEDADYDNTLHWKAKAYTLHDLFTEEGWDLMLEGEKKEVNKTEYWKSIYTDGMEVLFHSK
jgi:hypothetical protein